MKKSTTVSGFTIIELIVVVAIIGILASVVIIGYGAWQKNTATSVLKSDLSQAATSLQSARNFSGPTNSGYPTTLPSTFVASQGVQVSGGGRFGGTSYCVAATSSKYSDLTYYVSDKQATPAQGDCSTSVSVFAGGSSNGYVNGQGTTARFSRSEGVTVAPDGTLYVAENDNDVVRKVTNTGLVSTYAGTGAQGSNNGAAASATFRGVRGVALDPSGTLYVADINNNDIRVISPAGVVSSLGADVHATDVIYGQDGNLYALGGDNLAGMLYQITTSGDQTTIAGNGTIATLDGQGTAAAFNDPRSLTRASDGTIYVCENGSGLIRKVTASGYVSTYAGYSTTYSGGATSVLNGWCGAVALDKNGVLYVAADGVLQAIDKNGTVTSLASISGYIGGMAFDNQGTLWAVASGSGSDVYKIVIP